MQEKPLSVAATNNALEYALEKITGMELLTQRGIQTFASEFKMESTPFINDITTIGHGESNGGLCRGPETLSELANNYRTMVMEACADYLDDPMEVPAYLKNPTAANIRAAKTFIKGISEGALRAAAEVQGEALPPSPAAKQRG